MPTSIQNQATIQTPIIQNPPLTIQDILRTGTTAQQKAMFQFRATETEERLKLKFNLWARFFFPQYFKKPDAPFHAKIDLFNIRIYRGELADQFINAGFKGCAKTSRTKLFIAFVIANDLDHHRRYFRILSADSTNSEQISTDIYNMLVSPRVASMYPEIFAKTSAKREETMSSFTTTTGVKVYSDTVGTSQRGALQEDARPDFVWFEDFENRKTLRSAKNTRMIWDNMEEARTGLAHGGGCVYTCNYISEMGNVHTLVTKKSDRKIILVTPIMVEGKPTWPEQYSLADINQMKIDDDDFEGERMCQPSASRDIMFDRETLDRMVMRQPKKEIAGFKIFHDYDPSHRLGSGHDVSHGVGLDSSTSVFIDFDVLPCRVVATFATNSIDPFTFGDEIDRQGDYFGRPIAGIEKNDQGSTTIARARQLNVNLYKTQGKDTKEIKSIPTEYGWHTNVATKAKMIFALVKAVNDGLLDLSDEALIQECKSYCRNDYLDDEADPRVQTRHFDLLIACAIAWQMKDYATVERTVSQFTGQRRTFA